MQYTSGNPVYQESYYADAPITTRLSASHVDYLAGALLVIGGALLGRVVLGSVSYDLDQLAWVIVPVTYLVAWGNRR